MPGGLNREGRINFRMASKQGREAFSARGLERFWQSLLRTLDMESTDNPFTLARVERRLAEIDPKPLDPALIEKFIAAATGATSGAVRPKMHRHEDRD